MLNVECKEAYMFKTYMTQCKINNKLQASPVIFWWGLSVIEVMVILSAVS